MPYHHLHLDYPLLLPAVEAMGFRFMGSIDTQVIHLQPALLTAALLVALPRLLADRVPVVIAWASALLIGVAPSLVDQAGAGLADAPLAVFFAMAAVFGWRWIADGRREMLVLSALFAAAVLATKREGTPFVAAFFLVMLIAAGRGRRLAAVAAGAAALATAVPWQLWLHSNGVDTSNGEIPYSKVVDPGLSRRPARADPDGRRVARLARAPAGRVARHRAGGGGGGGARRPRRRAADGRVRRRGGVPRPGERRLGLLGRAAEPALLPPALGAARRDNTGRAAGGVPPGAVGGGFAPAAGRPAVEPPV